MTPYEFNRLTPDTVLIAPDGSFWRFVRYANYVRSRATYLSLKALFSNSTALKSKHNILEEDWKVASEAEVATISLIYGTAE